MAAQRALDFPAIWQDAIPYDRFIAEAQDLQKLWEGIYRRFQVPAWARERAREVSGIRFLCITEDWCWDAANVVPPIAKLCDESGTMELRIIKRDEQPEIMDRYLTNGSRSIPIVVALDSEFHESGRWGPRPRELQAWALAHKDELPKKEFYTTMRRWHVEDAGMSTLREVMEMVEPRQ
ncbi:MAG: thioredoxin family protein [Gemmatimonadota bacterium]|nr:thioredoxin family protein [Gemmatimonadota bacterium]